jgi:hypothetical protein
MQTNAFAQRRVARRVYRAGMRVDILYCPV